MNDHNKISVFSFWKENKLAGFFQLTEEQLIAQFKEWLSSKRTIWLQNFSITFCVDVFTSEHLNSVGNDADRYAERDAMADVLRPILKNYLNSNS